MASGISGTPLFEVSYQGTHDTNHKNIPNKIQLDLDAKYAVESVKCSGESHTALLNESGRGRKVLAAGIAIIQTPEIGYFVLEETGQVRKKHDANANIVQLTCYRRLEM